MLGRFDEAQCYIDQAISTMEVTGERVWMAEVHRLASEIVLASPCPDAGKAKAYFQRALAVSRAQQELRAATSTARLWRDQGKSQQARELRFAQPMHGRGETLRQGEKLIGRSGVSERNIGRQSFKRLGRKTGQVRMVNDESA
jgi:predicted ATPase